MTMSQLKKLTYRGLIVCVVAVVLSIYSCSSRADDALEDMRYCGEPKRDADGYIIRRADVIYRFQKVHPCPSTGKTTGACRGWAKDHVIPLSCGGCDSVTNMQWAPTKTKSCWQDWCKDRYERSIYAVKPKLKGTEACKNKPIIITDK